MRDLKIILWYYDLIYSHTHTFMFKRISSSFLIASLLAPMVVSAQDAPVPHEQDFILTAYYSPLPNQCCYIKGSYEADKVLNGNGVQGADGTKVYPGMLAGPPSYSFGTRIELPGLGTMTVHDRGGAIQVLDHADRLDVWAGFGEEGLARALAFGVKHIHGTVYPNGSVQPAENIDLANLPAPILKLQPFLIADAGLLSMHPKMGDSGLSVNLLQTYLQEAGYMKKVTSVFGDETKKALATFSADYGIDGDGSALTMEQAAYLTATSTMKKEKDPVAIIDKTSSTTDIQAAQRLLRYFGFYKGRTDGQYSDNLFNAILAYQQSQKLVGSADSPGAGRIGPKTRSLLVDAWKKKRVASHAETLITLKLVGDTLAQKGALVNTFLSTGKSGASVTAVQKFLAMRGFFSEKKINGHYGAMTAAAVTQYQVARGLIPDKKDSGAGTVGPLTLRTIHDEQIQETYKVVRAQGWDAL